MMTESEEAALRRLLDKEAIREAALCYTRGVDRHDDELMAKAYHADATDDHGTYVGDAAGFINYAREGQSRHWSENHHYIMNQTIDLDGDTAHVETYYLFAAAMRRKSGSVDMVGGRYIDRFERRDGRWAIADRACLMEWNGELAPSEMSVTDMYLHGSRDRDDLSYARPLKLDRPHREISF